MNKRHDANANKLISAEYNKNCKQATHITDDGYNVDDI